MSVDFDQSALPYLQTLASPDLKIEENNNLDLNLITKSQLNISKGYFYKKNSIYCEIYKNNIEYKKLTDISNKDLIFKLLTHPVAFSLFQRGDFIIHTSSIEIENKAVMFIGPSGSGKSFAVASLLKYGNFITEDIGRIQFDNSAYIFPSFPITKISMDQVNKFIENFTQIFKIKNDLRERRGCVIDPSKFAKKKISIAACFVLEPSNKEDIYFLNKTDSFKHVFLNSFGSIPKATCIQSEKILHKNIETFIGKVPIYKYKYVPDNNNKTLIKFLDENL